MRAPRYGCQTSYGRCILMHALQRPVPCDRIKSGAQDNHYLAIVGEMQASNFGQAHMPERCVGLLLRHQQPPQAAGGQSS